MDDSDRMKVSAVDGKIIIEVPLSLMVFAQRERPDFPLAINDEHMMSKWIKKYLANFGGDTEQGVTEFELFLDKMFIYAYENGETWLDPINYEF